MDVFISILLLLFIPYTECSIGTAWGKDFREEVFTDTVMLKREGECFTYWHEVSFRGTPESITIIRKV